jgi:hypothetical protein
MSKETYKVLEFKSGDRLHSKYAHPINMGTLFVDKYEWGSSDIPLLMSDKTTIKTLKALYKGLDFGDVKLVSKELSNIEQQLKEKL